MRKILFCLILFLLSATPVRAARGLTITSDKSSLFGDEDMLISASPSGFASGEAIFVKGAFYQDGSTNYFGYTNNNGTWIKNGDSSQNQYQVNMDSWDGGIRVKCDFGDSGYKGEGDYKLKLGFYYTTTNGTLSSVNWSSNILTVSISEPDPTPTETPQPTSTPTSTPVKTLAPTPIPTKTAVSTPKPTLTSTPSESPASLESSESGTILGANTFSPDPTSAPQKQTANKTQIFSFILIGVGIAFIGTAIYLGVKTSKTSGPSNDI